MCIRKVTAKFKNFRSPLDSGCSSTIVMRRLVENLGLEKGADAIAKTCRKHDY